MLYLIRHCARNHNLKRNYNCEDKAHVMKKKNQALSGVILGFNDHFVSDTHHKQLSVINIIHIFYITQSNLNDQFLHEMPGLCMLCPTGNNDCEKCDL